MSTPLKTFTPEELRQYDGTDNAKPIYVCILGTIYDVTKSRDLYSPGKGYSCFAGRDCSRGLAMSSTKVEDCTDNIDGLDEEQMGTLRKWQDFFQKKYDVVGRLEKK